MGNNMVTIERRVAAVTSCASLGVDGKMFSYGRGCKH